MENIKRLCPFCKAPLFPAVPNSLYVCAEHGFHVNYDTCQAYFGEQAPEYCKQSFAFLKVFFDERPLIAMNPNALFTENFKAVDTVYMDGGHICSKHKLQSKHVVDYHLIAGNGHVAYSLLRSIVVLHDLKCEVSPLALTYETPEQYLFNLSALASCDCSYKVTAGLGAYLMPTLESMASALVGLPRHKMPKLTNESVLYSAIFMQPQLNIKWHPEELKSRVRAFVQFLTEGLPSSADFPFDLKKFCVDFPKRMYETGDAEKLYELALKGNPSTAPNAGQASFDILQYSHYIAKGCGDRMTSTDLSNYNNLHTTLAALFGKYALPYTPCGVHTKRTCLKWNDPQSTPNDIVLSYWKVVNERLKKES